ncbi:MAG: AIR synthase, partial [Anaerotignum sp.]|nr:AIR synthase [Anaerotignum sp.]
ILGVVWEVAECSGLGVDVFVENIPVKEETKKICAAMHIDYLRLISSGTMIIAADHGTELVEKLQVAGIEAAVIGKLTEGGKYMLVNGMRLPLEQPGSDALYDAKL